MPGLSWWGRRGKVKRRRRRRPTARKPHEADHRLLVEGRFESSGSSWARREYIGRGLVHFNTFDHCSSPYHLLDLSLSLKAGNLAFFVLKPQANLFLRFWARTCLVPRQLTLSFCMRAMMQVVQALALCTSCTNLVENLFCLFVIHQ